MRVWQPGSCSRRSAAAEGRRLVLGGDEAAREGALPARPALPGAGAALDRLTARRDRGGTRSADPHRRRRRHDHEQAHRQPRLAGGRVRRDQHRRRRVLLRADLLHGLGRGAHACRPAEPPLPPPAAAVARLLRAQPRRCPDQPPDERRRGPRPARHRRRHLADPEHAHAHRRRRDPVHPLVEARARDTDRDPGAHGRDGDLPQEVGALVPARPRDAEPGHGDARRGHRRHARAAGVHARAGRAGELPAGRRGVPRAATARRSSRTPSTSRSSICSRRSRRRSSSATALTSSSTGRRRSAS